MFTGFCNGLATDRVPQTRPLLTQDLLCAEFGHLLKDICRILSKSPDREDNLEACKVLCVHLKASDSTGVLLFNKEKHSEIYGCCNFRQLFEILNQHLSWDEHSILTQIIAECDSQEAEKEFDKYKRIMAVSKALVIISSIESNPPPGFEMFSVIIDKPYKKLTVEEYEEIKSFIFDNLDVHRFVTNKYIRVLFDSLYFEWHVTIQVIPHMIKMAHERKEVFTKNYLIFMQIGKEIIIDIHTEQALVSLYVHI